VRIYYVKIPIFVRNLLMKVWG